MVSLVFLIDEAQPSLQVDEGHYGLDKPNMLNLVAILSFFEPILETIVVSKFFAKNIQFEFYDFEQKNFMSNKPSVDVEA